MREDYEFTIRTQFKQLMELCNKISYLEYKNEELQEDNERKNNIINKTIAILENYEPHYSPGELYLKDILLDILKEK